MNSPVSDYVVLLCNLGGPATEKEIKPFLLSLLGDPCVIRLPSPFKFLLPILSRYIVFKRLSKSKQLYQEIGGGSPLQKISQRQATMLAKELQVPVVSVMRHGPPSIESAISSLKQLSLKKIVVLPLFPQYSISTTESSFHQIAKYCKKHFPNIPISYINDYHDHELFIEAWVKLIEKQLKKFTSPEKVKIVFSAHSIPESYVTKYGDPYLKQIQTTCKLIMKHFPQNSEWELVFQSKFGKGKWLEPLADDYLQKLKPKDNVLMVPISFVSEHVETIHEMGIQFQEIATSKELNFKIVPTPNTMPLFIKGLASITRQHL